MHKRLVNYCTIELIIVPNGPILIKGREGADPTKPQMEFVETYHAGGKTIYLPGSSLKGAIRAHSERIVRTVGGDNSGENSKIWASNPLSIKEYDYLNDPGDPKRKVPAPTIYKKCSFTDQIFGSIAIASRLRIEDAYPDTSAPLKIEERNGVAIDRVFGSVAVGPFDYQVCTRGEFHTKIHLKNFSLAQLGLIILVLRDLNAGWFGIGFAKTRGLGMVNVRYKSITVGYPGCILKKNHIYPLGSNIPWDKAYLAGAGEFLKGKDDNPYDFPSEDKYEVKQANPKSMDYGFGVQMSWEDKTEITELFTHAVAAWSKLLEEGEISCAKFG